MKLSRKIFGATAAGVALFAMSGTASALTVQGAEFTAVASGSGTTWDLTLTMDFTNAIASNQFLGDMIESWSLTLPEGATTGVVMVTENGALLDPTLWSSQGNAQADASGCGGGAADAVCVDFGALNVLNGSDLVVDLGDIFTFTVSLVFADSIADLNDWTGNFHLLTVREFTNGCGRESSCIRKDGGLISQPLNVPEPSTLGLLGLGLIGIGLGSRRRKA